MTEKNCLENLKEIEMPDDMKNRIVSKCKVELEEQKISKRKINKFARRPMVAAASLVLCLCLAGATVLASTRKLQGFFKDVKRWDGAVVGTTYEQATDEIAVKITEVKEELTLEISMLDSNVAPYSEFELFGVKNYKIIDMDGKNIAEADDENMAELISGKVVVQIPVNNIAEGAYKLIISEMVGSAKADQPLVLSGIWEIEFTK